MEYFRNAEVEAEAEAKPTGKSGWSYVHSDGNHLALQIRGTL